MKKLLIILLLFSAEVMAQNYHYSLDRPNTTNEEDPVEEEEEEQTPPADPASYTYLFTEQARSVLKQRFETDYVTASGFSSDFSHVKSVLPGFLANPSRYRPYFGVSENISEHGELIHMAALYAYAMEDVDVANVIAQELLETCNSSDLNHSFWYGGYNFSNQYSLFVQTAKAKKLKDSYYLVKGLENVLSQQDHTTIDQWFADYKEHVKNWFVPHAEKYIGTNWENEGIKMARPEGIYPSAHGDPLPLDDRNGNPMTEYGAAWFQDLFNNRVLDNVAYLHSWAVYNEDMALEHYTREFFKLVIKYGSWPDGTFWELIRNKPSDNTLGVFYTNVSLTSLVYMAHLDSQANHFPADKLYDYRTTGGIVQGSTNLTDAPYAGGTTTDGVTQKSLKNIILGQSKYLRNSSNGGWNDQRFNNGAPVSTVGKRQNSVLAAIANIHYKDQALKDYYLYNTARGYPSKVTIYEGWGKIEDYGAWANFIIGGAWMEQENNF